MPQTMTGAQAVAEALVRAGIEVVFAIPGQQLDELFNAFYHVRDRIRIIHPRHEQTTAYMANGYALASGKLGVCCVVPGPGLLNASAAIATGFSQNAPVLCITGQIPSRFIGRGLGQLHEIKDQLQTVAGYTKFQGSAMRPEDVPEVFAQAMSAARSGRNRPTVVEIPPDILAAKGDVEFGNFNPAPLEASVDGDLIARAAELIAASKRPLIYAGSGALGASTALTRLAERLGAPVVTSQHGIGVIDYRHPLAHTPYSGIELWREADLAIAIGTRFATPMLFWGRDEAIKLLRIDVDPDQSQEPWAPDLFVPAAAEQALPALLQALGDGTKATWPADVLVDRKAQAERRMAVELALPDAFNRAIRSALADDAFVCFDSTQLGYHSSWGGFPSYAPGTVVRGGYQGTLGWAFPTALGVKVAMPKRTVVCVAGDGGFMFAAQEMATAVQNKINVITVVMNDGAYGNIKRTQTENYRAEHIAWELRNPPFADLARLFGMEASQADSPESLSRALRQAVDRDAPALIEVAVGEFPSWPGVVPRWRVRGETK
jgi:acetolactate synthase I/II/III large subunit